MGKLELLTRISFGKRIAEEETKELASYFVKTDQWRKLRSGEVDIVYGPKGAGKSALYALLLNESGALFDESVLAVPAENVRGAPAFKDITADPPLSQNEFVALWKLYLLSLVGREIKEFGLSSESARQVTNTLQEAGLLEKELTLQGLLHATLTYAKHIFRPPEAIEGGIKLDPNSGLPTGVTGKIVFAQPTADQRKGGLRSVDELFTSANAALEAAELRIWLMLDRLDVAFAETEELEKNALRALFQTYLDLKAHNSIALKIFLRSDIWTRITHGGFREASHITSHLTIEWDSASLLNLVVRRLLSNPPIIETYSVDPASILQSSDKQATFFYRVYPDQVDSGPNKPTAFDWMLSRTRDGTGQSAPRELIHLLNSIKDTQIRKLENGEAEPQGENLFSRASIKEGLGEVSIVRLQQTLYSEYPGFRDALELLRGEKTQQTPQTLGAIWKLSPAEAQKYAQALAEIGFFEERGTKDQPVYWVPFLYREALSMVQGAAEAE